MVYKKKSYKVTEVSFAPKSAEDILYSSTGKEDECSTNDININTKIAAKRNPFLGFFYTFLTSLNFTLASVMVKKLSYIDVGQLSLLRNAGVFVGSLPIVIYCVNEVLGEKKDRFLLMTRGFLGAAALYLNLTANRYLPLAEAAVVLSTAPALTTLIARVYLKESCSLVQTLCLVTTICGVLTSIRLPELLSQREVTQFDLLHFGGLAAAVGCVLTMSFTFVAIRKMKHLHFSLPMMYFGFLGMIQNAVINGVTSNFNSPLCGWDQVMYGLLASLGFFSNCTFTLSIQAEAAGIVSVLKASLDIIVAITFQILFFGENPDIYNICGACLIIISVSIIGIRNWLLLLPDESKMRKKLKYFLF